MISAPPEVKPKGRGGRPKGRTWDVAKYLELQRDGVSLRKMAEMLAAEGHKITAAGLGLALKEGRGDDPAPYFETRYLPRLPDGLDDHIITRTLRLMVRDHRARRDGVPLEISSTERTMLTGFRRTMHNFGPETVVSFERGHFTLRPREDDDTMWTPEIVDWSKSSGT